MAVGKEVKDKIQSIKNTQKITKAMEMVAASKMRRAQDYMQSGKPYAQAVRAVIANISGSSAEYMHSYMRQREVKNVGYILISTDRGLCGGLNNNLFKQMVLHAQQWQQASVEAHYCALGQKGISFLKRFGGSIKSLAPNIEDHPKLENILSPIQVMLNMFRDNEIDRLFLVSNLFENTMVQKPNIMQLLPLDSGNSEYKNRGVWDYIYEPDEAESLLTSLIERYVDVQVYQSVLENKACEMAARMIAMKNATDNASEFIDELQLLYNKRRQSAITQELSEIVAGAVALD